MHNITILKKVVLRIELFSALVTRVTKITGEWENNLRETYREGLAGTLCVCSLLCSLLQWRVCLCVDKLDLGFIMAFVRHGSWILYWKKWKVASFLQWRVLLKDSSRNRFFNIIIIIIIIFINCKWVDTRWQWLFYMYTECDIDYY
jgi:hypothetical protein